MTRPGASIRFSTSARHAAPVEVASCSKYTVDVPLSIASRSRPGRPVTTWVSPSTAVPHSMCRSLARSIAAMPSCWQISSRGSP
jgi:hypothetical protein